MEENENKDDVLLEENKDLDAELQQKVEERAQKMAEAIVSRRIAKEKAKLEKQISESDKYKNMSEDEKRDARIRELEDKIREQDMEKLKASSYADILEHGIPITRESFDLLPVQNSEQAAAFKQVLLDVKKEYEAKITSLSDQLKANEHRGFPPKQPGGAVAEKASPFFEQFYNSIKKE